MSKKTKKRTKPSATTMRTEFDILKIVWNDHNAGNHQWMAISELKHRPMIAVSVGINVIEDDTGITLAQNMGADVTATDTIYILKNCIVKKEKLGKVEYDQEN